MPKLEVDDGAVFFRKAVKGEVREAPQVVEVADDGEGLRAGRQIKVCSLPAMEGEDENDEEREDEDEVRRLKQDR